MPKPSYDDPFHRRLAKLWHEGLTTVDIGLQLGVSKNAVCGKRRRMGLPEREHPIGKPGPKPKPKPKPRTTAPKHMVSPKSQAEWASWFNRLSADMRRRMVQAKHAPGCLINRGLWLCQCGITMPGSPLLASKSNPPAPRPAPPAPPPAPEPMCVEPVALSGAERVYDHCMFPIGTPGQPGFRYCEAPIYERRAAYCETCRKGLYTAARPQEVDARSS